MILKITSVSVIVNETAQIGRAIFTGIVWIWYDFSQNNTKPVQFSTEKR